MQKRQGARVRSAPRVSSSKRLLERPEREAMLQLQPDQRAQSVLENRTSGLAVGGPEVIPFEAVLGSGAEDHVADNVEAP